MLYVGDHEETYPPSADYSAATDDPGRIWDTKLDEMMFAMSEHLCFIN